MNQRDDLKKLFKLFNLRFYSSWYISATTNKAASIYENASTIHSLLNLKLKNDLNTGNTYLEESQNTRYTIDTLRNCVIFIDECSMINEELYSYLDQVLNNKRVKIIYIGDKNQLPPVNSKFSIFNLGIKQVELEEPVRYKDKDLKELADILKSNVETGLFSPIHIPNNSSTLYWLNADEFQKEVDSYFKEYSPDNKILAYTNEQVNAYNNYIQALRNTKSYLVKDRFYILNTSFSGSDLKYRLVKLSIPSGTEIIIKNISRTKRSKQREEQILLTTKIKVPLVEVTFMLNGTLSTVIATIDPVALKKAINVVAKAKKWPLYFFFRDEILNLSPGDALTVHKSQGSTYKNVFIDLNDICSCRKENELQRLLYVACTRASEKVFLCGTIPHKFGGIYKS